MAFDEDGQADNLERRKAICERAYRSWPTRSASRPRTSSSTRTSSPSPRASRSTRTTAWTSSRPPAGSSRTCPARWSPAASPTCVLVPRQQPGPRGDPLRVPLPRDRGRPGHGHRQRRRAGGLRRDQPELRERIEDVILNRRPDSTERLLEIAEETSPARSVKEVAAEEWRVAAGGGADHARAGQGHRRLRRGRHRGAARRRSASAAAARSRSSRAR